MKQEQHRRRIAVVVPGFSADESDWCIPVLRTYLTALARRHEVVVITPHYPYRRGRWSLFGTDVHCLSDRREEGLRRLVVWRRFFALLRREHARAPFDLLHAFWASETGFLTTLAGAWFGIPTVVSVGGGEFAALREAGYGSQLHPHQRFMVRRSLLRADAVTGGSRWLLERIPVRASIPPIHLPLGIDTDRFRPVRRRPGAELLTVASLYPWKDLTTLLRAIAIVRRDRPDARLTIVGQGVEREALALLAQRLGIVDSVDFAGEIPHERMPTIYARASLLVQSGRYESQGMALLEGLATGLSAVSTAVGIAAELPPELVTTVPVGDVEELAAAILRRLAVIGAGGARSEGTAADVAAAFSIEQTVDRFEVVYDEAVAHHAGRRGR